MRKEGIDEKWNAFKEKWQCLDLFLLNNFFYVGLFGSDALCFMTWHVCAELELRNISAAGDTSLSCFLSQPYHIVCLCWRFFIWQEMMLILLLFFSLSTKSLCANMYFLSSSFRQLPHVSLLQYSLEYTSPLWIFPFLMFSSIIDEKVTPAKKESKKSLEK